MHILPIRSPILKKDDNLGDVMIRTLVLEDDDVIVVSSKAIATIEGAHIDLSRLTTTKDALQWSKACGKSPAFCQAVLNECKRMNGEIIGSSPFALLTRLTPQGMTGCLLVPNAGLDESNTKVNVAIGWPHDPVRSCGQVRQTLMQQSGKTLAIIISDSCCSPGRTGVTAFALSACGIDPLRSEIGAADLFGKTLRVTQEALADQLATAANMVMGNAAQSTPAAVIRGHGRSMSDFCGWVPGIRQEDDIFGPMFCEEDRDERLESRNERLRKEW